MNNYYPSCEEPRLCTNPHCQRENVCFYSDTETLCPDCRNVEEYPNEDEYQPASTVEDRIINPDEFTRYRLN